MRDIKFRIWDLDKKEFIGYSLRKNYAKRNELIFESTQSYPSINYIIQQYTGLKDKNGKEIYEGDIVRWFYRPEGILISKVVFEEGDATFRLSGNGMHRLFSYEGTEQVEVIGNIYENPELLRDKSNG